MEKTTVFYQISGGKVNYPPDAHFCAPPRCALRALARFVLPFTPSPLKKDVNTNLTHETSQG